MLCNLIQQGASNGECAACKLVASDIRNLDRDQGVQVRHHLVLLHLKYITCHCSQGHSTLCNKMMA